MAHPYAGIEAALTTKHKKGDWIAPAFNPLGVSIKSVELDTDQLGTFSPERPRTRSQRDTVIEKARLGMAKMGVSYGTASEASIGPDPLIPFLNSIVECMVWLDLTRGIEILNFTRSLDVIAVREEINESTPIEPILLKSDFPNHGLLVYAPGIEVFKGIRDEAALGAALERSFASARGGTIFIESDLRAHMSPSRQLIIAKCAAELVDRLSKLCPRCEVPGFGRIEILYGLPCEFCGGQVNGAVRGEVEGCTSCGLREERLSTKAVALAAQCNFCNP